MQHASVCGIELCLHSSTQQGLCRFLLLLAAYLLLQQVAVESWSPEELDYSLLEGKWLLQYTTAVDVVSSHFALGSCNKKSSVVYYILASENAGTGKF